MVCVCVGGFVAHASPARAAGANSPQVEGPGRASQQAAGGPLPGFELLPPRGARRTCIRIVRWLPSEHKQGAVVIGSFSGSLSRNTVTHQPARPALAHYRSG